MATEKVYIGAVGDITRLLAETHFPDDAYFVGEQQPQHVISRPKERQALLLFAQYNRALPFADYTAGRIFHQDFELRWEREDGETRVVYVGTEQYHPASLEFARNVEMQKPVYYYLFGERLRPNELERIGPPAQEGDFAEVRIPRLLHYPVQSQGRRVLLAVSQSLDPDNGSVTLFRFQGIEARE